MEEIPSEDRSVSLGKIFEAEPLAPSILGLHWNVESDGLEICRGMGKEMPAKVTQRIVLLVTSVFDPLGLFSSFTLRMRMLLKEICKKHGQSWDEEESPSMNQKKRVVHKAGIASKKGTCSATNFTTVVSTKNKRHRTSIWSRVKRKRHQLGDLRFFQKNDTDLCLLLSLQIKS